MFKRRLNADSTSKIQAGKIQRLLCTIFVISSNLQLSSAQDCNNPTQVSNPSPSDICSGQTTGSQYPYCCPDYKCCSLQEIQSLAQDECPAGGCPGRFECCDGFKCCSPAESGALLSKCTNVGGLCDSSLSSRLECCPNSGSLGDGVCCTEEQRKFVGESCTGNSPSTDCSVTRMECNGNSCGFEEHFSEDSVALFIVLLIAFLATVVVVAAQIACCVFWWMRKKRKAKENEEGKGYKDPEVRPSSSRGEPAGESRFRVQLPTLTRPRASEPPSRDGRYNPGFEASPEPIPMVEFRDREARARRDDNFSPADERSSRDQVRDPRSDLVANRRSRSQDPRTQTDSMQRETLNEEPRRRFPSQDSQRPIDSVSPNAQRRDARIPRDNRISGNDFDPRLGQENRGFINSNPNFNQGSAQRNDMSPGFNSGLQQARSFDQDFPSPPPRNENRNSSSLLRNSQPSLHNGQFALSNNQPRSQRFDPSFRNSQPVLNNSRENLSPEQWNSDAELRYSPQALNHYKQSGNPQSRNAQPVLRHANQNTPGLRNNEGHRTSLQNYQSKYVVEEDENDTLVIGGTPTHRSWDRNGRAGNYQRGRGGSEGNLYMGEERNLDDPENGWRLPSKVTMETEIN